MENEYQFQQIMMDSGYYDDIDVDEMSCSYSCCNSSNNGESESESKTEMDEENNLLRIDLCDEVFTFTIPSKDKYIFIDDIQIKTPAYYDIYLNETYHTHKIYMNEYNLYIAYKYISNTLTSIEIELVDEYAYLH